MRASRELALPAPRWLTDVATDDCPSLDAASCPTCSCSTSSSSSSSSTSSASSCSTDAARSACSERHTEKSPELSAPLRSSRIFGPHLRGPKLHTWSTSSARHKNTGGSPTGTPEADAAAAASALASSALDSAPASANAARSDSRNERSHSALSCTRDVAVAEEAPAAANTLRSASLAPSRSCVTRAGSGAARMRNAAWWFAVVTT
jgi:hypothetical protein